MNNLWFMEERTFKSVFPLMREGMKPEAALGVPGRMNIYGRQGNKAVISVNGVLRKGFSWYGTNYDDIRSQIEAADKDKDVDEIALAIDSGGGSVIGIAEVVQAIKNASKPVIAYCSFCGSAAYYIASQCKKIIAEENAIIGSIGTLMVIEDWSKAFEDAGIKVNVIASGDIKGAGTFGTALTEAQRNAFQSEVMSLADNFKQAVMSGRGFSQEKMDSLATGEAWVAKEALNLGLIDEIDNNLHNSANSQKGYIMSDTNEKAIAEAKAAGIAEGIETGKKEQLALLDQLIAAFPDNIAFAMTQFKAGANVITAKAAYADVLAKELAELKASKEVKAEAKAEPEKKAEVKVEGTSAVPVGKSGGSSATTFSEFVAEIQKADKCTSTEAVKKAKAQRPDLFEATMKVQGE